MSLYFWLMLGTIAGPFFLSFDKKIHFHTYWKALFPAIFSVALLYIVWDEIFTQWGLWGFSAEHLQGFYIGNLPLEEILFFFFVPYACVFIYEVLIGYFHLAKTTKIARYFAVFFLLIALILGSFYIHQIYSVVSFYLAALSTIAVYFVKKAPWFGKFVITFLVVQIPFFLVNGVLTGMATDTPIVWYNSAHISNIRVSTIPLEDFFYNYTMLLLIFVVYNWRKEKQGLPV